MDLNFLYERHQLSLFRPRHAATQQARALAEGRAPVIARLEQEACR